MFKLLKDPQFTHVVSVQLPVDGGHREETMKARFRVVPEAEVAELDLGKSEDIKSFLRRALVSVDDVADEAGAQLTWSDDLRETILSLAYVRLALLRVYFAAVTKARLGN